MFLMHGCATPAVKIERIAEAHGFAKDEVQGNDFHHVVYSHRISINANVLHVYIEGDGRAWLNQTTVSRDPTPSNPLMLNLMALDSGPSLYLGRPCYFGLAETKRCSPMYWTNRRFSPEVVKSMKAVLLQMMERFGTRGVVLAGHSGGGVVAMLLAQEIETARVVVTLAGNFDIQEWAAYQGYSPLEGSLNPTDGPLLSPSIRQFHYAGGQDRVVPANMIDEAVKKTGGRYVLLEQFDHLCCWEQVWPSILEQLAEQQ